MDVSFTLAFHPQNQAEVAWVLRCGISNGEAQDMKPAFAQNLS
jgi:hypothetical protein